MRNGTLILAMVAAMGWQGTALAQTELEQRIQSMEQQMRYLEGRVQSSDAGDKWWQGVSMSGLVEVEAVSTSTDDADTSDIAVATVELGLEAELSDWARANVVLLYEEDATALDVDAATLTFGNTESVPFYLTIGRTVVPFGRFVSHLVSDPLTLELGETSETTALVGFKQGSFYGNAFVFNGDTDTGSDDTIDNGGLNLGYALEGETGFDISLSYLSDLSDADAITDAIGNTVEDDVPAWNAYLAVTHGPFTALAEYLAASDSFATGELDFRGRGAEPSAWNVELGYTFELAGKESTFAIGYQGTDEALDLDLPEQRLLVGLSVALAEYTSVSFEWARDEDYAVADGGTGEDSDTFTVQVALEF